MDTLSYGIESGMSQVDSFESDGHHASGTATFIDLQAAMMGESPPPMETTFEVTCPES